MAFEPLKTPRSRGCYTGDKIKVAFIETKKIKAADNKSKLLLLYIGHDVANKLDLADKDRVMLYRDSDYPLVWYLKKDIEKGWKVVNINKNKPKSPVLLKLQITWKEEVPGTCDSTQKFVGWDIYKGGIRLYMPGLDIKEQQQYVKEAYVA